MGVGRILYASSFACGLAACGVFLGGPDEAAPDSGSDGAAPDVVMHDAVVLPETGMDCDAGVLSETTTLVLGGASGCPVGTMREDLVTSPVAGAGACSCGACTPANPPLCGGSCDWTWGSNNNCTSGGPQNFNFTSGTCTAQGGTIPNLAAFNRWTTLTPSAGTCTAASLTDTTKVTSTPVVRCVVPAMRQDILCGAKLAGGYKFCVPASDGGCQAPYTTGVTAGTDTSLACPACACSHTAAACTVEYHNDASCTSLKLSRAVDGTCIATGGVGPVSHFKVFPTGVQCVSAAGLPMPGLTNAVRMCCTP